MSNFSTFLTPVSKHFESEQYEEDQIGARIAVNFDSNQFDFDEKYDLALIYVPEYRGCDVEINPSGELIRKYFYKLYYSQSSLKLADFGNIMPGSKQTDTYFAVQNIVQELLKQNTIPIIIGGSVDITYSNYLGYIDKKQAVNITSIDSSIGLGEAEKEIGVRNYLNKILLHQPGCLFNFSNIGYQNYLVSEKIINLIDELHFDTLRLGIARNTLKETEPIIRNADMVSFHLSAVRQADAPENIAPSPNGFTAEEACQMMWYAGISDKLSSIGIYGMGNGSDNNPQTANMLSQMIWHFIEGYYNRKKDFPLNNMNDYLKYIVNIENSEDEIIFLKSKKSERWWIDVSNFTNDNLQKNNHFYLPCTYEDYKVACENELPDRWIKIIDKLK